MARPAGPGGAGSRRCGRPPGTAMPWSSTPTSTGRPCRSSTGPPCRPSSTRPPTTSPPSICRSSHRSSRRPTPWSSRPRPSATWSKGCSRWPATTSCCSAWGSTTRTTAAQPGIGRQPGSPGRAGPGARCRPSSLCLGRVDEHKGTTLLAAYFARYKERHPGPLRLVLAGPVVEAPPDHPDIDVVGSVSEGDKWELLGRGVALVTPSPWEAFSLVVAEAWSARTPVLVNAGCAATVEHCRRSGGGLYFDGYGEFEVAVDRLVADDGFGADLGRKGRAYVDARFRWPVVDRPLRIVRGIGGGTGRAEDGTGLIHAVPAGGWERLAGAGSAVDQAVTERSGPGGHCELHAQDRRTGSEPPYAVLADVGCRGHRGGQARGDQRLDAG